MSFSKNLSSAVRILHPNIFPKYGKGSWLYTSDKKQYLDFTSGIGTLSTGYSNKQIINSVQQQLYKYVHSAQQVFNIHEASNNFTRELLKTMPNKYLDTVFYVNSGSEATDNAIKIARTYTGRQNIIAMNKGFHGRTYGAMAVSSSNLTFKKNIGNSLSNIFFSNINDIDNFNNILTYQTNPDEVCCVIVEPVQGEGGIYSLDSNFLKYIEKICNDNGILLIADEVQCGSGRTGTFWNIEQKYINPDILTFGKGIASGFQMAGLVSKKEIMDNIGKNFLGGTYGGNAISCSAGIATLKLFEEKDILKNVNELSSLFQEELSKIPQIKEIRINGLMIAIEIDMSFYQNKYKDETEIISVIIKELNKKRVLILACGNKSQYLRLLPPLTATKYECKFFINEFKKTLNEI